MSFTYEYTIDEYFSCSVLAYEIGKSTVSSGFDYASSIGGQTLNVVYEEELIPSDKTTLDEVVAALPLESAKFKKSKEIDSNTRYLISGGFEYSGKQFSLSDNAQRSMLGLDQSRDDPAFVYPVIWNTLENDSTIELADADEAHVFFLTGLGTVRGYLDSGSSIKSQIRSCQTTAEVWAIVDPRV